MEVGYGSGDKTGFFTQGRRSLKALTVQFKVKTVELARNIKKLGQDDPRRVIHSLKVGLALTLVSMFYYCQPLYSNFDETAIWAIMTVVVVFEFSVGATLGKGLNRGMATLMAGGLGAGAHHLANLSGHIGEPILLGFFVFLQATISTFLRFFPKIKSRYDYGMLIFILTFSLISVSGYRDDEILELAHRRLSTICIGGATCVIISIVIFPVWAGEDLHNLIALNIEKLGNFLEGFGDEYFKRTGVEECNEDKKILEGYKSFLNSNYSEGSLANFAAWEPGHGRFPFRHPWKLYLKVGTLARECAYRIEALNGYLNADIQVSSEVSTIIQEACTTMSLESGKALKELALAIKIMVQPSSADSHIENAKSAAKNIKSLLKSGIWEDIDLLKVIPGVTVCSILVDVVTCTEKIAASIHELASKAQFKSAESPLSEQIQSVKSAQMVNCPHVITVSESTLAASPSESSSAPKASKQSMEV
ncbi:aluminum-activated malate transporter 2-like [Populus nigra]|uniref:aluminum-activated malate transporter 2-like n=1 Tax=Populus nigra TaxID=3691 RepID=UPI002B279BB0|nr:aluminum-activated malate transporter 2-like [Populus nigra]